MLGVVGIHALSDQLATTQRVVISYLRRLSMTEDAGRIVSQNTNSKPADVLAAIPALRLRPTVLINSTSAGRAHPDAGVQLLAS